MAKIARLAVAATGPSPLSPTPIAAGNQGKHIGPTPVQTDVTDGRAFYPTPEPGSESIYNPPDAVPSVPRFNPKLCNWSETKQPEYCNVLGFLSQDDPDYCDHDGPCQGKHCACAENRTTCRPSCKCEQGCPRQFPRCSCVTSCGRNCHCRRLNRDCLPAECSCVDCPNTHKSEDDPSLTVRESSVPGAGQGLFAAEDIKAGVILGEYTGRRCPIVDLQDDDHDKRVTHFQISKGDPESNA